MEQDTNPIFQLKSSFPDVDLIYQYDERNSNNEEVLEGLFFLIWNISNRITPLKEHLSQNGFTGETSLEDYNLDDFKKLIECYNGGMDEIRSLPIQQIEEILSEEYSLTSDEYERIDDFLYGKHVRNFTIFRSKAKFKNLNYGELTYYGFEVLKSHLSINNSDIFVDLGCGVGQIVFQAAATTPIKKAIGVECDENRINVAKSMNDDFKKIMKMGNFRHGEVEIIAGSFLYRPIRNKVLQGSIFFIHNTTFTPDLNESIKEGIIKKLKENSILIMAESYKTYKTINKRNVGDVSSILKCINTVVGKNLVSYKPGAQKYFIERIDRSEYYKFTSKFTSK
uniref:Histone-lysine N-methyltransferase, H3 lysine-79 specific n=1 Tax=Parastrongyloides trichosuri TaxID=131310 RepID=A0A0N5A340_PARTI